MVVVFFLLKTKPQIIQAQDCVPPTNEDNPLSVQDKLNACKHAWDLMEQAKKPHQEELRKMETDIASFQKRIKQIEGELVIKEKEISEGESEIAAQTELLSKHVRQFYIRSYYNTPLILIFSQTDAAVFLRELAYQQAVTNQDKKIIGDISLNLKNLDESRKELEGEKATLASLKSETDKRAESVRKLVAEASAYQASISSTIASLTARQQEFLGQKLAGLNISRSAFSGGACIDDRPIDPGFSPRLAFFSFGVPNRIGMNQWGAKGRAEAGQEPRTILAAYYSADYTEGYNQSVNIHVVGRNEFGQSFDDNWNIEEYLKHLYEIPTNWDMKVLKAQAIAARSYALAYTNNGSGSICPSQQCQVVKRELNNDTWQQAVRDTAGVVLTNGGQPIKAWFSSTHGGYVFASGDLQGWSSTSWTKRAIDASGSISSFSDLFNTAYDRGSPWFYCDWGSRSQYNKTAWLKPDELADIVNVILLARKDSATRPHLYQTDKSNPEGTDTWDAGRVRSELGSGAFNNITDVSISWDNNSGLTTQVSVSGDAGNENFSGNEFKDFFNLRAPANIQIVGPLFNIEKK